MRELHQRPPVAAERILILDADTAQRATLAGSLRADGFEVVEAATAEAGLEIMRGAPVDGVLCAARASGWSCSAVVSLARAGGSDAAFIVTCRREHVGVAIEALRSGAESYVVLPDDPVRTGVVVERALEKRRLRREARELRDQARARLRFVGNAPEASAIDEVIRRAAPTKATVLLQGEAGTGRSFVAEMIHEASPRRDRPFVRAGCAGLSETLLDVRLFGSDGAVTGEAPRRREGLLERADGGTLYLHEVASLAPSLQVKLLRVLKQGEYERVGESRTVRADVRVVACTRLDLAEEVRAGRFRDDLYYRLNVVSLALPPLRARKGDLPALAAHFLAVHGRARSERASGGSPQALSRRSSPTSGRATSASSRTPWPGQPGPAPATWWAPTTCPRCSEAPGPTRGPAAPSSPGRASSRSSGRPSCARSTRWAAPRRGPPRSSASRCGRSSTG